jgi:hypothetical protein
LQIPKKTIEIVEMLWKFQEIYYRNCRNAFEIYRNTLEIIENALEILRNYV